MPIEDKNGCLHSEDDGKFINKTDPVILDALCKAMGVNDSVKEKRKTLIKKISQCQNLILGRKWIIKNFGYEALEDMPDLSYNYRPSVFIHNIEHWSRLQVMFSDYHRGASKPIEKNGIKYFNVDNTLYLTEGEYPYFRVFKTKTFKNTFRLERFLKSIK